MSEQDGNGIAVVEMPKQIEILCRAHLSEAALLALKDDPDRVEVIAGTILETIIGQAAAQACSRAGLTIEETQVQIRNLNTDKIADQFEKVMCEQAKAIEAGLRPPVVREAKMVGIHDEAAVGDVFSGAVAGKQVCGRVLSVRGDGTIMVRDEFSWTDVCISVEARMSA